MKRLFDLFTSIVLLLFLIIPMLIIMFLVRVTSKGPILYWSQRIGRNNHPFKMPKFRTMKLETPVVATHLLDNPDTYLSPIGGFLRRYSLDELPQLFSVLKGDISLVGPRPALFNQKDLIALRKEKKIDKLLPGITGWAQVNGRDILSVSDKVDLDEVYMLRQSFWFDLKILWMTFLKVLSHKDVSH